MVARQQLGTAMQRRTNSKTPSSGATSARTVLGDLPLALVRRLHHGVEKVRLVREAAVEGADPDVGPQRRSPPWTPRSPCSAKTSRAATRIRLRLTSASRRSGRCSIVRPAPDRGAALACHARSSGPKAMAPTMTSASAVSAGCGSRSTMEGASRFGMASAASAATTSASPLTANASM